MGDTGLRPDEAKQLQHRDVAIVEDPDSLQRTSYLYLPSPQAHYSPVGTRRGVAANRLPVRQRPLGGALKGV